jgi:hypothetical protein
MLDNKAGCDGIVMKERDRLGARPAIAGKLLFQRSYWSA